MKLGRNAPDVRIVTAGGSVLDPRRRDALRELPRCAAGVKTPVVAGGKLGCVPAAGDYWLVNSYGYPNPFGSSNSRVAWDTLLSFTGFQSYDALKADWNRGRSGRRIDPHTVESWKATFEEFGLLYVLSGTDRIHITPAGRQFIEAGRAQDPLRLGWIGLNTLLRYPLRGGRTARSSLYEMSDLLIYWFLYAAMRELSNYFWWSELERVLSKVFRRGDAQAAVDSIRKLRAGEADIDAFPLPVEERRGAFYNSLNQVVVHASLNYLTIGKSTDDALYFDEAERRHWIVADWIPFVDLALGGAGTPDDCVAPSSPLQRMPSAPDLAGDERAYFEYLGRKVGDIPEASAAAPLREIAFEGGTVAVLVEHANYECGDGRKIHGPLSSLCRLARGQRVVVSHDFEFTYIVEDKARDASGEIVVELRRARPISDPSPIEALMEEE